MEDAAEPKTGTKEKILNAAEELFAERGFADTSLRDITSRAGVNLAAVNYHFQSKDTLIHAVFTRRVRPLNQMRLRMLDELEAAAGAGPLSIESVLRAFLEPVIRGGQGPHSMPHFARLISRLYSEPGETPAEILRVQFGEVKQRFFPAFVRALPGLPLVELVWRVQFAIGATALTIAAANAMRALTEGLCDTTNPEAVLERLIPFLSAGFNDALARHTQAPSQGPIPIE